MKRLVIATYILLHLAFAGATAVADDHSPTAQLQPLIDQLIEVLDDEALKGDPYFLIVVFERLDKSRLVS